ncbi:MAG: hypothetical protein PHI94_02745 [Eubacteriaceae bacterium]|jgi:hypothetical protein|nr:hypothetical protein [Eubacteriaceae bacterium]MDD4508253.1 hypothetical protein [Eubacteriaceae bacterium]
MKPHKMKRCVPVLLFVCFLIPMLMLPGCTFNTDCQKDAAEHLSQILVTTYTTQVPDSAAVLTDYQDVLSHPDDTALCAAAQATLNAQVTGDVQCASLITNAGDVLLSTDPGRSGTSVVDSYVNKRMKGAHLDVFAELAFEKDTPVMIVERRVWDPGNAFYGFLELTLTLPDFSKQAAELAGQGHPVILIGTHDQSVIWIGGTPSQAGKEQLPDALQKLSTHATRGDLLKSQGTVRFKRNSTSYTGVYQEAEGLGWIVVVS